VDVSVGAVVSDVEAKICSIAAIRRRRIENQEGIQRGKRRCARAEQYRRSNQARYRT
jgi:hypothetical protein